jgi:uncharacterized protein YecT (DUF1311 family)
LEPKMANPLEHSLARLAWNRFFRVAIVACFGLMPFHHLALARSTRDPADECQSSTSSMSAEHDCYSRLVAKLQRELNRDVSGRNNAIAGLAIQGTSEGEVTKLQDAATRAEMAWDSVIDAECGPLARLGESQGSKFPDLPSLKCKTKVLSARILLLQGD